ncbi:hypothetical protein [Sulfuriflexus mobilis]|uniref:hypothetical protein n=1 Tax=Sulfuriflexus mobilis TaxID=1811807 RepID=UPI000F823EAC|nr:hypothetical protein [Sulfuriflexus mobilis]
MRNFIQVMLCAVLFICGQANAGHITKGKEASVVIIYCVLDTTEKPVRIEVEAVSVNVTRQKLPHISVGESCAQALHEFLTAGFDIVNHDTATNYFVLTREDEALSSHPHRP